MKAEALGLVEMCGLKSVGQDGLAMSNDVVGPPER